LPPGRVAEGSTYPLDTPSPPLLAGSAKLRAFACKAGYETASYFGLVPSNRLGHITKQGPATARKYLVEAAWQATLRSPTVRAYYQRILNDQPERRKIALVATAHYLLRCMHAMLRSGEVWREAA